MRLLVILLALSSQQPPPPAPPQPGPAQQLHTRGGSCPHCDLRGANLAKRDLTNANLSNANLSGADLRDAILDGVELVAADLSNAKLDGARLGTTSKGPANLTDANLTGASFKDAKMRGALVAFAELAGTDFTRADLRDALFERRIRSGTAGGRKTTFREAQVHREFTTTDVTADVTHVHWLRPRKATGRAFPGDDATCGTADLSHLTSRVYVANAGTDQAGCGTSFDNACQTISYGITNCAASGCGVLVLADRYTTAATIALRDGVNVYGGCNSSSRSTSLDFSSVAGPTDGATVVSATGFQQGTIFQNFELRTTGVSTGNSKANMAMVVSNSQNVSILNSFLVADVAGIGNVGATGVDGQAGASGSGTVGGIGPCGTTKGGNGAGPMDVSVDVGAVDFTCYAHCDEFNCWGRYGGPFPWTKGGQYGDPHCVECPEARGGGGHAGDTGSNGSCGIAGIASMNVTGSFSSGMWVPATGGTGGQQAEQPLGGGGGGSGGYKAGSCFWVKSEHPGNAGGGGGAGGCFGMAGHGGQQGGPSFALVLIASNVVLTDVHIVGGVSGSGGAGGVGGRGGAGGSGGIPPVDHDGGYGGNGGVGGAGGAAGGGAGGNSGPAIGIALVSGATVNETRVVYFSGIPGVVGSGGNGGGAIITGACTGVNGEQGKVGLVADKQTY